MTNEARLLAERDRLFATISVSKERYRDFLETMADHYKQPLATQVGLFLHAPASGRAYASEELWQRMGTSLKSDAKGVDVLSASGEATTIYEVTETEDAARLRHLVWQYDDAKDGESISSLNGAQKMTMKVRRTSSCASAARKRRRRRKKDMRISSASARRTSRFRAWASTPRRSSHCRSSSRPTRRSTARSCCARRCRRRRRSSTAWRTSCARGSAKKEKI